MPKKFVRLVLRGLFRSRTRLIATLGGCAVAAFIVAFFTTAQHSLDRMLSSAAADQNLMVSQKDRFWPTASVVSDDDARRIGTLPQVAEVMPVRLKMTPCMAMSDTIAVHGVDKDAFQRFRNYRVEEQAVAAFRADPMGALVGEKIAARYGWKAGDHITLDRLENLRLNIHGVFSAQGAADDFVIVTGRTYLQDAENARGLSHHVLVKLRSGAAVDDAVAAIETKGDLTTPVTAQPEQVSLRAALDQLHDLVEASRWVIFVVLGVILVAMGNAISMATRDRAREFGVLRTLGFSKASILALVLSEAVLLSLAGGLIGCAIVQGLVATDTFTNVSSCGVCFNITIGYASWVYGLGAIVLAGSLGALVPAWRASQLNVVEAVRRED